MQLRLNGTGNARFDEAAGDPVGSERGHAADLNGFDDRWPVGPGHGWRVPSRESRCGLIVVGGGGSVRLCPGGKFLARATRKVLAAGRKAGLKCEEVKQCELAVLIEIRLLALVRKRGLKREQIEERQQAVIVHIGGAS
jgi:hypothetical protein